MIDLAEEQSDSALHIAAGNSDHEKIPEHMMAAEALSIQSPNDSSHEISENDAEPDTDPNEYADEDADGDEDEDEDDDEEDDEYESEEENNVQLDPLDWQRQVRSCLSNPLLGQPLAYFEASISPVNPRLFLQDAGKIGLPLSIRDFCGIEDIFNRKLSYSPTTARPEKGKTFEFEPEEFAIRNPKWGEVVSLAVRKAVTALKLGSDPQEVIVHPPRLLILGAGVQFSCKPTSTPGVMATLAIYLPSEHSGGKVICSYDHFRTELDTSECSDFESSMLAWFGDASHQICEVTSGCQCLLLYELSCEQQTIASSKNIDEVLQRLRNLIAAWTKPQNYQVFSGPLIFTHEEDHPEGKETMRGRDLCLLEILQDICASYRTELYIAQVQTMKRGYIYDEEDEERFMRRRCDSLDRASSTLERGSSPEVPKLYSDDDVTIKLNDLSAVDGTEIASEIELGIEFIIEGPNAEGKVVDVNKFSTEDSTEDDGYGRTWKEVKDDFAEIRYERTAFVLLPKHECAKFFLEHEYSDNSAEDFLEQDVQAVANSPTNLRARVNVISTCKVIVKACLCRPRSSLSEGILSRFLEAFALVGRHPSSLDTACFKSDIMKGLRGKSLEILAAHVNTKGFKDTKEPLTWGVWNITSFADRYEFLHFLCSNYGKPADCQDKADMVAWVVKNLKESLMQCKTVGRESYTAVFYAAKYYGIELLHIASQKLDSPQLPVLFLSRFLDVSLRDVALKDSAISIFRDVFSHSILRIQLDPAAILGPDDHAKQLELISQNKPTLPTVAKLLHQCYVADMLKELEQITSTISFDVSTSTSSQVEAVYLKFSQVFLPLFRENAAWIHNPALQVLFRTIIKKVILSKISSKPNTPDQKWREKCSALVSRIEIIAPASLRKTFLGDEVFALLEDLRQLGTAPIPPAVKISQEPPHSQPASSSKSASETPRFASFAHGPQPTTVLSEKTNIGTSSEGNSSKRSLPPQSQNGPTRKKPVSQATGEAMSSKRTIGAHERRIAKEWVKNWMSSRPKGSRMIQAFQLQLEMYSMWHHQRRNCAEIASLFGNPLLPETTVKDYICCVVEKVDLAYDEERMKDVVFGTNLCLYPRLREQMNRMR